MNAPVCTSNMIYRLNRNTALRDDSYVEVKYRGKYVDVLLDTEQRKTPLPENVPTIPGGNVIKWICLHNFIASNKNKLKY